MYDRNLPISIGTEDIFDKIVTRKKRGILFRTEYAVPETFKMR